MLRSSFILLQDRNASIGIWALVILNACFWGAHSREHMPMAGMCFYCINFSGERYFGLRQAVIVESGTGIKLIEFYEFNEGSKAGTITATALAQVYFLRREYSSRGLFAPTHQYFLFDPGVRWETPATHEQLAAYSEAVAEYVTNSGQFGPPAAPIYADLVRRGETERRVIQPWAVAHDSILLLVLLAGFVAPVAGIVRSMRRDRIERRRALLAAHQCPRCLYDISATPDTCPECGEELTPHPPPVEGAKAHAPDVED